MKKTLVFLISFLIVSFLLSARAYPTNTAQTQAITVQEIEPFVYFCVRYKGPFSQIQEAIGKLMQEANLQNITPQGSLIGIYYSNPAEVSPEALEWEMGFPVTAQAFVQAPLDKKEWNFTKVASALHKGSYETAEDTIMKILDWMDSNGYAQAGPILERYLDMDPFVIKPEDLRTEIWVPVKKKGA
jgi:effector-binding domain-containing protein